MFKKTLLFALIVSFTALAYGQTTNEAKVLVGTATYPQLSTWDVKGTIAKWIISPTSSDSQHWLTPPLTVPAGAEGAQIHIYSATIEGEDGYPNMVVSGTIGNATLQVQSAPSSLILSNYDQLRTSSGGQHAVIPAYIMDATREKGTSAAWFQAPFSTGMNNYGLYQVPLFGEKYLQLVWSSSNTSTTSTVVVDFNPVD